MVSEKKLIRLVVTIVLLIIFSIPVFRNIPWVETDENTPVTVSSPTPTPQSAVQGETTESSEFIVTRVIDGDTIELFGGEKLRYIGIDTPEKPESKSASECFAREAIDKNKELVLGKKIRIEKDVSERDRYGRLLRYVWVGDIFVNDYLVREGYATAITYPPDIKNSELFRVAEKEARENNRGLWNSCNS